MRFINIIKLKYLPLCLILINTCTCGLYAEKKIYTEHESPPMRRETDEEEERKSSTNPFYYKCYECEDCVDTDHLTDQDSCDTYNGCYKYKVTYEQVPETGNKYKITEEINLGCLDSYTQEFCSKKSTNRTGPCLFCYKNLCNLPKRAAQKNKETGNPERSEADAENNIPALMDPIRILNRKKPTLYSTATRYKLTWIAILFILIYPEFYV